MIRNLIVLAGLAFSIPAVAQEAHVASIRFHGQDRPGVEANYPIGESLTKKILVQRLSDAGLKKDDQDKGFRVYKEVEWPDIATGKVDIYVKVDGKKDKSLVQVMITRGYDNFINPTAEPQVYTNLQNWLNGLGPVLAAALHDAELQEQQAAVKEAERDLRRSERQAKKEGRQERREEKDKEKADKEKDKKAQELAEEKKKLDQLKQN